jgi:hypothetical protein
MPSLPSPETSTSHTKLTTGLCSDRYSPAATPEEEAAAAASKDSDFTLAVEPRMFKALVGKGHPEFSSGRQQDAQEYLDHLLGVLMKAERVGLGGQFYTEALFKCVGCGCLCGCGRGVWGSFASFGWLGWLMGRRRREGGGLVLCWIFTCMTHHELTNQLP